MVFPFEADRDGAVFLVMRGQIAERVIECIAVTLEADATAPVSAASHLRGQLGADSLDYCDITQALEEDFHISITDAESDKWETVSDVIATVERKIS